MRCRQTVTHLPISEIRPSPSPVRDDLGNLDELVATIREHGVLDPLLVTPSPGHEREFTLIGGRRRFAAALLAGLDRVPVVIRHGIGGNHVEQLLLVLAADTVAPLTVAERAQVVASLFAHGVPLVDVVRRTGLDAATLHWYLTLVELDGDEVDAYLSGDVASQLDRGTENAPTPAASVLGWFNLYHPAAGQAAEMCGHAAPKIGGVACGPCWEAAIVAARSGADSALNQSKVAALLAGEAVDVSTLTRGEQHEVVRVLDQRGTSAAAAAAVLGVSTKTVHRIRRRLREGAPAALAG